MSWSYNLRYVVCSAPVSLFHTDCFVSDVLNKLFKKIIFCKHFFVTFCCFLFFAGCVGGGGRKWQGIDGFSEVMEARFHIPSIASTLSPALFLHVTRKSFKSLKWATVLSAPFFGGDGAN